MKIDLANIIEEWNNKQGWIYALYYHLAFQTNMKRKSISKKRKNELTDLNIGHQMTINNGKYE